MLSRLASLFALAAACACGGSSEPAPVEPVAAPGPGAASDPAPAAAQPAEGTPEDTALLAAAEDYTRKNAAAGLRFTLKIQTQEGDFALIIVEPVKEDADGALLFMKREAGTWRGLTLGTGIDCSDLADQGVPASLCASLR